MVESKIISASAEAERCEREGVALCTSVDVLMLYETAKFRSLMDLLELVNLVDLAIWQVRFRKSTFCDTGVLLRWMGSRGSTPLRF